jgi:uncharacterized protein (DUF4415 family)
MKVPPVGPYERIPSKAPKKEPEPRKPKKREPKKEAPQDPFTQPGIERRPPKKGASPILDKGKSFRLTQRRVCMYIDLDVLNKLMALAQSERMKYQPFINKILRLYVTGGRYEPGTITKKED